MTPSLDHTLENLAGGDAEVPAATAGELTGGPPSVPRSRTMFYLHLCALIFGAGLLVIIVRKVGLGSIGETLRQIGFGFVFLVGIVGLRHALRTTSLWFAVPPQHRRFSFWRAFSTRLGGEAVSFLTFTGPVLGEATKVAMLRRHVPLAQRVQAVVVDNLLYNLSVALFISSGALVLLLTFSLPPAARVPLIVIATGMALSIFVVVWAVVSKMMPLAWTVDQLARLGPKRDWLLSKRPHVVELETNVYNFYRDRPRAFFAVAGTILLSHATSVIEVYVTLRMLGLETTPGTSYVIDSLTKVINLVFSFVPATIGVYEGGTGVILRALGHTVAAGVTLGIVRKAAVLVWTAIGLLALIRHTAAGAANRILERHPKLRKAMDNLVLANVMHRPARTLVSILGVAVGVLLIIFTVGLAHGVLRERGRREADVGAQIMLRPSGTIGLSGTQSFTLPESRAAEIERIEGVRAAVAMGQATVGSDSGFGMRVVEGIPFEQYSRLAGTRIVEGRAPQSGDEAMVDARWIEQRKAKVGDTLELFERPFRIVGIYEPPGGSRIKIPLETMQEQIGVEGHVSTILVAVNDPAEQEAVAARIHERFPEDQLLFTRDLPELYASGVPALNVFLGVVVGVAAAISLLVILLATYTTVTERTRQIGVLKSLGMSNAGVAWVIEQEAILVSVLGVVTGILLTLGARLLVTRVTSLTVEIEPKWVGISLLIGLLGGTIGALYPALRAARQDPVDALSYE